MARRKKYEKVTKSAKCTQAVVFARVSSKRQKDEGVSLEVQMDAITKYCTDKGLNIIGDYSIDESSTQGERTQYHQMLDFVQSVSGTVAIVVNYVDRLQRNYDDTYLLNKLRKEGKIEVHFLRENLIITKDSNSMELNFWNMHVLMANSQVNNMIDKVKASQRHNWACGKWQGQAPLGYINKRDKYGQAIIVQDEIRAPIIKHLYEEFVRGGHSVRSLWMLAKELNLETRTKGREGLPISLNTMYEILTNPFYYGEFCIKGELIPHIYPPLISKEMFDRAQELLIEKGNHNRVNTSEYAKATYIFRGLIHCECGCLITPEKKIKKSGKEYIYLRCSHKKPNIDCHQGLVTEKKILEQIKNEVLDKIALPTSIQELLAQSIAKDLTDTLHFNSFMKGKITKQLTELRNTQDQLTLSFASKRIREDLYNRQIEYIDNEIAKLEANLEKYRVISTETKEVVSKVMSMAGNISDIFEKASITRKSELLKSLLDDCILKGNKLEYKIKAPFDKLIGCRDYKEWTNIALNNIDEIEKVKIFQ